VQALMGLYASLADRAGVADPRPRAPRSAARRSVEAAQHRCRSHPSAAAIEFRRRSRSISRPRTGWLRSVTFASRARRAASRLVGPRRKAESRRSPTCCSRLLRIQMPGPSGWTDTTCGILALDDLPPSCVLVDQEPFIFHTTIADNNPLRAGPARRNEEVRGGGRRQPASTSSSRGCRPGTQRSWGERRNRRCRRGERAADRASAARRRCW